MPAQVRIVSAQVELNAIAFNPETGSIVPLTVPPFQIPDSEAFASLDPKAIETALQAEYNRIHEPGVDTA